MSGVGQRVLLPVEEAPGQGPEPALTQFLPTVEKVVMGIMEQ